MSKQTIIEYVDDISGETFEDGETVTFGLDGKTYEIDLNLTNSHKLRDALAEYITHSRRGARDIKTATRSVTTSTDRSEARKARQWLQANGYTVSDRGRIPGDQWDAYRQGRPAAASNNEAAPEQGTAAPDSDVLNFDDADVLAWHQAKGHKVPDDGKVNGLMRHRYEKANVTGA